MKNELGRRNSQMSYSSCDLSFESCIDAILLRPLLNISICRYLPMRTAGRSVSAWPWVAIRVVRTRTTRPVAISYAFGRTRWRPRLVGRPVGAWWVGIGLGSIHSSVIFGRWAWTSWARVDRLPAPAVAWLAAVVVTVTAALGDAMLMLRWALPAGARLAGRRLAAAITAAGLDGRQGGCVVVHTRVVVVRGRRGVGSGVVLIMFGRLWGVGVGRRRAPAAPVVGVVGGRAGR